MISLSYPMPQNKSFYSQTPEQYLSWQLRSSSDHKCNLHRLISEFSLSLRHNHTHAQWQSSDALLGAAALGDIGKLFPDTDPAFKGADSRELLREAWRRIQAKGYTLGNVDVTIIAQAPKMLPHIPQMRVFIAEDLGCHMDDVNVKATTTEKLGFTGRGEGIACEAVALLIKAAK